MPRSSGDSSGSPRGWSGLSGSFGAFGLTSGSSSGASSGSGPVGLGGAGLVGKTVMTCHVPGGRRFDAAIAVGWSLDNSRLSEASRQGRGQRRRSAVVERRPLGLMPGQMPSGVGRSLSNQAGADVARHTVAGTDGEPSLPRVPMHLGLDTVRASRFHAPNLCPLASPVDHIEAWTRKTPAFRVGGRLRWAECSPENRRTYTCNGTLLRDV